MTSIVFVDDAFGSLDKLQHSTRALSDTWEMRFFADPERALSYIRENSVDVVVADVAMTTLAGPGFLELVREVQPACARVILSEYEDESVVFGATRIAHQVLAKPCDVRELRRTIERIHIAQQTVEPDAVRDLVGRVGDLPSLGPVYAELMDEIEKDDSTSESLGAIVSEDLALTAELLRFVNSSFFGLRVEISSIAQAVSFLGFDVVRAIVLGQALFAETANSTLDLAALGRRAKVVGAFSRRLAGENGGTSAEAAQAFLAGMLHEVGALVLSNAPDIEDTVLRGTLHSGDQLSERLLLSMDRYLVGAHLLALWGFASDVVEAVAALSSVGPAADSLLATSVRSARDTLFIVPGAEIGAAHEDALDAA